ncbi:MAG: FHA domain-containing protein [Deltaproteobacteria bacterium]|nr:FHA domain-containing protein [Deltaproteobacteria bacterium]
MSSIKILLGEREISTHPISKENILLGRAPEADIFIPNLAVSRKHGRIFKKNGKWYYEDLCSTNGTYLNTSRISLCQLNTGTELVIGKCRIIFSEETTPHNTHSAYSINIKKLLEDEPDNKKGQVDETIKFDKTAVIKINPLPNGNGKKQLKPISYIEIADTKEKINISDEITYIGKDAECKIRLNGLLIASKHAKIEYDGENIRLIALKNFPAVSVNGIKITERILKKDDYIDIGSYRMRIRFF